VTISKRKLREIFFTANQDILFHERGLAEGGTSGHMNSCGSNASSDVETPGEANFPSKIRSPATTRGMLVILGKKR